MVTECNSDQRQIPGAGGRQTTVDFSGGTISSDGGAMLLKLADDRIGLTEKLSSCFSDFRDQKKIEHSVVELLRQRIMGLALGYEDLNDHDKLSKDPLFAAAVGKEDPTGKTRENPRDRDRPLAGKSTLNRLELSPEDSSAESRYKKILCHHEKVETLFVDLFLDSYEIAPEQIVLDFDLTDDIIHGDQEGRFYHGYYRNYCYLPLYVFSGEHLLVAKLREAKSDSANEYVDVLDQLVDPIRKRWPKVEIIVRADSGFCRDEIMTWCEKQKDVYYLFGLRKNSRLNKMIDGYMTVVGFARDLVHKERKECQLLSPPSGEADEQLWRALGWHDEERMREIGKSYEKFVESTSSLNGNGQCYFRELTYSTKKTWSCERRVVAKCEQLSKGPNQRYVVTNLPIEKIVAKVLYRDQYCQRGEMENRIKEQQLDLFADRTSTAKMRSNQLRLWFSSFAYVLLFTIRRIGLESTKLAKARCSTIRNQLLKVGAQVKVTVRRVWQKLSSAFPNKEIFLQVWDKLAPKPMEI